MTFDNANKKQTRCGYSRRSKQFALAQNFKAAFVNTQSTSLSKENREQPRQLTNSQKSPEEKFCLQISPEGWLQQGFTKM